MCYANFLLVWSIRNFFLYLLFIFFKLKKFTFNFKGLCGIFHGHAQTSEMDSGEVRKIVTIDGDSLQNIGSSCFQSTKKKFGEILSKKYQTVRLQNSKKNTTRD